MISSQINQLPPAQQEAAQAGMDLFFVFVDEYFVKDLLDILCDNKGNYIIRKLVSRISQQIDRFVEVEDTTELDEATYQELKGNVRKVVRLLNSGSLPEPNPDQLKQAIRQINREDIGTSLELMRKFFLKVLDDPELYNYLHEIPAAWRPELKTLGKSCVNFFFGFLDRDLLYELLPLALDAMDQKINDQEALSRFLPILTKHLKK
jgi:hypothetical protein